MGKQFSGVYNVRLWKSNRTISVFCDFDTDSGGWTVIYTLFYISEINIFIYNNNYNVFSVGTESLSK